MVAKGREIRNRTYVHEVSDEISVEIQCRQVPGVVELQFPDLAVESITQSRGHFRIERMRHGDNTKKPKVIAAGPTNNSIVTIDPDAFLFQYDHLFFVDTNTKSDGFSGDRISVTAAVHAFVDKSFEGADDEFSLLYHQFDATEFRNSTVDPERLGWALVLRAINQSSFDDPSNRIAIVGDAHLGAHKQIAAGKTPVIDGVFLPEHIDLIYASSDTGKESGLNALMNWCDRAASFVLRHIIENQPQDPFHEASGEWPFDRSRTWTLSTS